MPTPLTVAAPLRFGLRSVDEQGRFIEAAEVFELKGEAKVRQKSHVRSWRKLGHELVEENKSLDLVSKVGIEHVGGEGPR